MKTFNSFKVLNKALGEVSSDAFRVLYYICNNLKINKTIRTDIDRIDIAVRLGVWYDGCGKRLDKQLKNITTWTDELVDKGFIKKDVIYDRTMNRRTVFYAISDTFVEEQVENKFQNHSSNCPKKYPTKREKDSKELNSETSKVENEEMEHQFSAAVPNYEEEDNLPF